MAADMPYAALDFKSVGTRPVRPDGVDKVTGRARYGADYNMPGQLVGRVLRSPHAHARIRQIDTSKAEALPGVKAVITAADLPDHTDGGAVEQGRVSVSYLSRIRAEQRSDMGTAEAALGDLFD